MLPIIQKSCMIFDVDVSDWEEAIHLMADCLYENGYLKDKALFCQDVYAREKIYPTCIGNGIGIPHGKSEQVKHTGICILRLNHPILWNRNQDDKEYVDLIFLIAVEETKINAEYLEILADLARNLMHSEFVNALKQKDVESAYSLLLNKWKEAEHVFSV